MSSAVGTRLNLALCREKQGRTATAWSLFTELEAVLVRAGDTVRATIAHQHGAALASQLKKIVIEVPTPPAGLVLKLDGVPLPTGALGTEIPLDPGNHNLVASAPGKKNWEQATIGKPGAERHDRPRPRRARGRRARSRSGKRPRPRPSAARRPSARSPGP